MSLTERIALPRLQDAVEDGQHLIRVHGAVEWLVVDVVHAAWVKSPHPISGRSVVVFSGDEFRCEIYLDDLFLAAGGILDERSRTSTIALLAIAVLGFPTVAVSHSCTKERSPVILRQAFLCCWCGPDAAALR